MIDRETLERLAEETGARLGELGVRASDRAWIEEHARTIASLAAVSRPRRGLGFAGRLYRLARRAARTAR